MNRFNLTMTFLLFMACAIQARADDAQPGATPTDAWTATHMLNPGDILRAEDVSIQPIQNAAYGAFSIDRTPVGLEVKHRVLSGRPLHERDVGRHSLVKANAPVRIMWRSGAIAMQLDGRSLQDGAAGDTVRALNTASSRTIQGVVQPDGSIQVGGGS